MGGKFARVKAPVRGGVRSAVPALTHEGGAGFSRDAKGELFLLAVANMVGEDTFYEAAGDRDNRFAALVHQVTQEDPAWVAGFVPYLRNEMRMRSAAVVMAAEYVAAGGPKGRAVVTSALQRPDEPAEMLAYWHGAHGRNEPQPLKRGIADALPRLYTERNTLKYDGTGNRWRFGDVIERVHAKPINDKQARLYKYLLDTGHRRDKIAADGLTMILNRQALDAVPVTARAGLLAAPDAADTLSAAGMTWEDGSAWVQGPLTAEFWTALIPNMGAMALVRNLRNMDDAGISNEAQMIVKSKLITPEEIARSRQLPLRFYRAWAELGSMHWGHALDQALELSLANVPVFGGRTLVLIDVSGSMEQGFSGRGKGSFWEHAAVFGFAVATRSAADVVAFSTDSTALHVRKSGSVLRAVEEVRRWPGFGHGTDTWNAVNRWFSGHDRVVIITDEQVWPHQRWSKPAATTLYTFNVAGYRTGHGESGEDGRYTFGGLSDAAFQMIPLLEAGHGADWPWIKR